MGDYLGNSQAPGALTQGNLEIKPGTVLTRESGPFQRKQQGHIVTLKLPIDPLCWG